MALALTRHGSQRNKLAQQAMIVERIRAALHGVQASILEHIKIKAKHRMPRTFGYERARIYDEAFGLTRNLTRSVNTS